MLPYFKKHVIAVCAIAVALPVIASMIWPLFTGSVIASSVTGMILQFVLFFGGLLVAYRIFERHDERMVEDWLRLYNVDCDPEAFLRAAAPLAAAITFPCNAQAAWFLGYYAQALLDAGRHDEARAIEEGLRESIQAQKKPLARSEVISTLIPLVEKTGTLSDAKGLIDEGLDLISRDGGEDAAVQRAHLESQLKLIDARMRRDFDELLALDRSVVASSSYPMRLRVELAWDGASASYKMGDVAEERELLDFICQHGGGLALVDHARKRLDALSEKPSAPSQHR